MVCEQKHLEIYLVKNILFSKKITIDEHSLVQT
jgi:hypothetical protein